MAKYGKEIAEILEKKMKRTEFLEMHKKYLSLISGKLIKMIINCESNTSITKYAKTLEENFNEEQIKEFFVSLNSGKYGNVLDKIPLTEELLKDIRKNNIEIPQELKKILMFIKSIIKFIKDTGIVPIREMGNVFIGTAEDIAEMDYTGNEFREGEVKKLKVIAPGYKYKDIISLYQS